MWVGRLGAAARKRYHLFFLYFVDWAENHCFLLGFEPDLQHVATIYVIPIRIHICICVCFQNLGYSMAYRGIPLAPPTARSIATSLRPSSHHVHSSTPPACHGTLSASLHQMRAPPLLPPPHRRCPLRHLCVPCHRRVHPLRAHCHSWLFWEILFKLLKFYSNFYYFLYNFGQTWPSKILILTYNLK